MCTAFLATLDGLLAKVLLVEEICAALSRFILGGAARAADPKRSGFERRDEKCPDRCLRGRPFIGRKRWQMMEEHAAKLLEQIRRGKAQRLLLEGDAALAAKMPLLRTWQADRLSATYKDLQANERYRPATAFFLSDLYGPNDFSRRDKDIERLFSTLVKLLPDYLIEIAANAAELNALSAELDFALLGVLVGEMKIKSAITPEAYAEAYRRCGNDDLRRHQIALLKRLGEDLDAIVFKPLVYNTVRMLRIPARLAGFGALQDFLDRGFQAFHHMQGAGEFMATIVARETRILDRIYASHPRPFAPDGDA